MGDHYRELRDRREHILYTITDEERRFHRTLDLGLGKLEEVLAANQDSKIVPGAEAFKLYDTFGVSVEITKDIAMERGYTVDLEGFQTAMAEQREKAAAADEVRRRRRIDRVVSATEAGADRSGRDRRKRRGVRSVHRAGDGNQSHRLDCERQDRRSCRLRRQGGSGAGRHAVLRRIGRSGQRRGRDRQVFRAGRRTDLGHRCDRYAPAAAGPHRACGRSVRGRAEGGRRVLGAGRLRSAAGHHAQSHGHALAARAAARTCWGSTCSRPDRWSRPIGSASTSRTARC